MEESDTDENYDKTVAFDRASVPSGSKDTDSDTVDSSNRDFTSAMYDDRASAVIDLHDGVSGSAASSEDSDTTRSSDITITSLHRPLVPLLKLQLPLVLLASKRNNQHVCCIP